MRALLLSLQLLIFAVPAAQARQDTEFGRLVARLSEAGGFFDSDNLVSNETSYLHVIPAFKALKVQGTPAGWRLAAKAGSSPNTDCASGFGIRFRSRAGLQRESSRLPPASFPPFRRDTRSADGR